MKIAVVIPCYRAKASVCGVIQRIGPQVQWVYVVDDACPEGTGAHVQASCADPRVAVLRNAENLGVGGAMVRGYREALAAGADVIVKVDGDGQMDPALIPQLVQPIVARLADYTKGNRFAAYSRSIRRARAAMPKVRWFGNSVLSFGHKAMSGYWNVVDPTNGYTAIHRYALEGLDLDRVSTGYFFAHDMLFQLNIIGAVVRDGPMAPVYAGEVTSLRIDRVLREFPLLMLRRLVARIVSKYFIYDFNVASIELLFGTLLLLWGVAFGAVRWIVGVNHDEVNTAGTVMLSALPIILGVQLLLAAVSYDVNNVPRTPLVQSQPAP